MRGATWRETSIVAINFLMTLEKKKLMIFPVTAISVQVCVRKLQVEFVLAYFIWCSSLTTVACRIFSRNSPKQLGIFGRIFQVSRLGELCGCFVRCSAYQLRIAMSQLYFSSSFNPGCRNLKYSLCEIFIVWKGFSRHWWPHVRISADWVINLGAHLSEHGRTTRNLHKKIAK